MELDGRITPNRGKPQRLVGQIPKKLDLAQLARAVNSARTPHRDQAPPGVALVLMSGKLDANQAKEAMETLKKVEGVDAKGSSVNAKEGEVLVKLTGVTKDDQGKTKNVKLTLDDIREPLIKAGVLKSGA